MYILYLSVYVCMYVCLNVCKFVCMCVNVFYRWQPGSALLIHAKIDYFFSVTYS